MITSPEVLLYSRYGRKWRYPGDRTDVDDPARALLTHMRHKAALVSAKGA